jgi:hypothetical protein
MGSTFYLFYMVLFTGGVLWCLFLWLVKDDEEDAHRGGDAPPPEAPSPGASARSALDGRPLPPAWPKPLRRGEGPPGEAK